MTTLTQDRIQFTIGAAVPLGGSFTVPYPTGRGPADYVGGTNHEIMGNSTTLRALAGDFTATFGPASITITLNGRRAMAGGNVLWLYADRTSLDGEVPRFLPPVGVAQLVPVRIGLGRPAASSPNAVALSQAATAAGGLATGINGALAAGGVATLDVPRALVAAWTGAAVLTVTGTDEFGRPVRESSASGTTFTGRKAFRTVTGVTVSANVTALTVGTGKVLGLPVFLGAVSEVIRELENDATPGAAGAILAGDTLAATALTGDVRGTYAPASNPDGARLYELLGWVRNPAFRGVPQFGG